MKLIGNLKKRVEQESTMEGRHEIIKEAGMILTDEELDNVAGGSDKNKYHIQSPLPDGKRPFQNQ